jgi:hypothetical protein
MIGGDIFDFKSPPISNASYIKIENTIADELHVQTTMDNSSNKNSWGFGTILLAAFNGDLEAGNIK